MRGMSWKRDLALEEGLDGDLVGGVEHAPESAPSSTQR